MKKLTTFLLALLLCCSVFVACTTDTTRPESTPTDSSSIATEDSSTPDSSIVEESALDSAVKYVRALYIMDSATTAANYYVIAQAPVGDQTFDIEWSVDVTEGVAVVTESDKEGMVLIDVTRGETDVNYVLTATLTDGTDTKSVSFNRVVPFATVNTYAEYAASEKGDSLTVRGIVIGWEDKARGDSANSIYLQDLNNEGGYYLYSLSELPAGLAVGVTIEASGEFDIYSGTYELKNVSAKIIDSEANPVAPVDYTEAFINAADTKAAELVARQSMLVTLKDVTITDQDAANGYLNFTLGGKTAYLRISSSHNCITKDEQTAMKALHAEKRGFAADVTGYVAVYNGAFYLVPVDANAISNIYVPERTDAEKVAIVKDIVDLGVSGIAIPTTLSLPTSVAVHPEVSISWTAEGADVVDNKTTLTPGDADRKVKFTATITCGDVSEQVPFDIAVYKTITPASPVGEVLRGLYALVNGTSLEGTYKLVGTITKIKDAYSEQFKNITVIIEVEGFEEYPVICFRLKGDGIADLKKGDVIGVKGTLKNYNGDREFNSGCTLFDPNQKCGGCGEVGEEHAKCESCGEYTCNGEDHTHAPVVEANIKTITLTSSNLGLTNSYLDKKVSVSEVEFALTQVSDYGNGIQMRINKDNGIRSAIANISTLGYAIKEIRLTCSAGKNTFDNSEAFLFAFGTSAKVNLYSVKVDTKAGVKSYVITPDEEKYCFFNMSINIGFSFYFESIEIVLDLDKSVASTCFGCDSTTIHEVCSNCNEYLCVSEKDHSTCNNCQAQLCTGDHGTCLDCQAQLCTGDHTVCQVCGEKLCVGDHSACEAPETTPYSYTFSEKVFTANGTKELSGIEWTLAGDGGYWGFDNTKGHQFGSSGNPYKSMTLTSESLNGVRKITINTSGASSTDCVLTVKVGGEIVKTISLTTTATEYTIDVSNLSGAVEFSFAQTKTKAIYIKSISIEYTA